MAMKDKETNPDEENVTEHEFIPYEEPKRDNQEDSPQINIKASIGDRRYDKVLKAFEKADPGFIRRMAKRVEAEEKKTTEARFNFSRHQAYVTLFSQVLFGIVASGSIFYIISRDGGLLAILGGIIFFAVSQGGDIGFRKIAGAIANGLSVVLPKSHKDKDK